MYSVKLLRFASLHTETAIFKWIGLTYVNI